MTSEMPQSFEYNNNQYYLLESIRTSRVNDAYFVGCKSTRKCIDKHNVPDSVCLYLKGGKVYTKTYKAADVYIEKEYADTNILDPNVLKQTKQAVSDEQKKVMLEKRLVRKQPDACVDKDLLIENAPPLVHLDEHEMFKDTDGLPMDIEVRGEKSWDKAYFKAYDVGKAFAYERINNTVLEKTNNHVYGRHYTYFRKTDKINPGDTVETNDEGRSQQRNNVLYLTYLGVIKVLMCARGDRAERFQEWAARVLFTMQMGDNDARDKVAAEALQVGQSTITEVFRKSAHRVPCVYLFELGKVRDLRSIMNLSNFSDDNAVVYKYGMTSDMARRSSEHAKTYGKIKGSSFKLTVFAYIDATCVSKAETTLKQTFDAMNVRLVDKEIIVADREQLGFIKKSYDNIYAQYSGNNADLVRQLQTLQYELNMKNIVHENEILKKDNELMKKDHELIMKDNAMKDLELTYLRKTTNVGPNR